MPTGKAPGLLVAVIVTWLDSCPQVADVVVEVTCTETMAPPVVIEHPVTAGEIVKFRVRGAMLRFQRYGTEVHVYPSVPTDMGARKTVKLHSWKLSANRKLRIDLDE